MSKALIIGILFLLFVGMGYFCITNIHPHSVTPIVVSPTPVPVISQPNLITPQTGFTITGPLVIKGYIPKSWTFEGQFRMKLLDAQRKVIIQDRVPVEWDNENQKTTLYFVQSYNYATTSKSGFLVLENDNPSGLPENQKNLEIPIKIAPSDPDVVYLFLLDDIEDKKVFAGSACEIVMPVAVTLNKTISPIKDTLNLLANRMHPDFYVKSINLKNGLLTIDYPDIPGFTTGGSCAQNIHRLEVEKTALQFSQIKQIKLSDGMFQP